MTGRPKILSIQSDVVLGHVGHGAARPAMLSLGVELLALPTVLFSNHPGHGGFRGRVTAVDELMALLDGLEERAFLDDVHAVHSGYLGDAQQAGLVRDAVLRVKRRNRDARYLLDPVFGDDGGAYARPGVAEAMSRDLLPLADIVTPNRFELASLTGLTVDGEVSAAAAARKLGRPAVIGTSVPFGPGLTGIVMVTSESATGVSIMTDRIDHVVSGMGDLFAALFLGRRVLGETSDLAARKAVATVAALVRAAKAEGAAELPIVAHRDWLSSPPVDLEVVVSTC